MNQIANSLQSIATKPKVCHFSSVHHQWDTRVFYRECRSLAKEFEVTFIGIGNFTGVKDGVKLIGIQKPKNPWIRFVYTLFKVFIEAVKVDAQIYHIHDAEMIPFGIVLSLSGKKVIYDIHENTYDDILLKPWLPKSARIFFATLYNGLLRLGSNFLHYIVVIADPIFLPKFFVKPNQYTIIQNFADVEALIPYRVIDRASLEGNNLFYIGMIRDMYYDINPVLEAIYILKQKGIECRLHLIGYFGVNTDSGFESYKNWEHIKNQVIYYGFKEMDEAYKISMQCKVGICLKNQPQSMLVSHERKLFEYMAIGLPSIFCNSHIYTAVNNSYKIGVAIDLQNPVEIADSIEDLLKNPEKLNEWAQNNLTASKTKFDWKLEEETIISLYFLLLKTS